MKRLEGRLELWGGLECTVARIGDEYRDQLAQNGHLDRPDDVDRFAALGIRTIRYPVLWERTAPHVEGPARADWRLSDERLTRLRALGVAPIAGLVHHGSGPRHTSLLEESFVSGLAAFAGAVARRYPWIEQWTPVNEPLTTARFSALYGHWYPHARDERSFLRALFVQCRAIKEAMRAIRAVNSSARLIQTEDVGETYATVRCADQAEFDNHRRWLSLDLLAGRVTREHPLWEHLARHGFAEEAARFAGEPCPPEVVGLNYYVTSDRLLDERLPLYPSWAHGGNGRDRYADVEAVRARAEGILGHRAALRRAWERYRLPVALTEVQLGSTREQQLRWLAEAWRAGGDLRQEGVDVRAITVWALLGAFDWNSLLVRADGSYEPGAYDVRGGGARPTALARMVSGLAQRGVYDHPALDGPGWWRRPDRLLYGGARVAPPEPAADARPLLIVGATGTLGRAFARVCRERGLAYRLVGRAQMDIAERASVEATLEAARPWAVVNGAGYVRVDDAERDEARCFRENALGPRTLALACAAREIRLLTFSSDLVFGGDKRAPYVEGDAPAPASIYGRSKAVAEAEVLRVDRRALVIRTSAFFGPWDSASFVAHVVASLRRGELVHAADDLVVTPTYVPDLVHAALDLLIDEEHGLWHLANPDPVTWADLAQRTAARVDLDGDLVVPCPARELGFAAPRPAYSALGSERALLLPGLDDALGRYAGECVSPPARGGGRASSIGGG